MYILSAALAGYTFGGLEPSLQSMAVHTSTDERAAQPIRHFYAVTTSATAGWWHRGFVDYRHGLFEYVDNRLAGLRGKCLYLRGMGASFRYVV